MVTIVFIIIIIIIIILFIIIIIIIIIKNPQLMPNKGPDRGMRCDEIPVNSKDAGDQA